MNFRELKQFLDEKVIEYNRPKFIENDPISIPHQFSKKQDIEIAGFFASILAWGQRKTIINKCNELMARMDHSPYAFMRHHSDQDLKGLLGFKHRTFNDTDLLYFVAFFKSHYNTSKTLESAFLPSEFNAAYVNTDAVEIRHEKEVDLASSACFANKLHQDEFTIEKSLNHFRAYFFSLEDYPSRTIKHISSPLQKSTCKRLNMFLRWMVRKDNCGVDFGIWHHIPSSALICPCDVHVDRVARQLGLINRKQTDWLTAVELTNKLKQFDPSDPVKYDFALFGMGAERTF